MMAARRYGHLLRLLSLVLLAAFLIGTAPCAFAHADEHADEETACVCVCVCCQTPVAVDEQAMTRTAMHPPTSRAITQGTALMVPRDLVFTIFQPPRA